MQLVCRTNEGGWFEAKGCCIHRKVIRLNGHVPFCQPHAPLAVETPHPITPQVAGSCLRDDHPPFCLNTRILSVMRQDSRVRDDLGDREMPTSFGFRHKHVALYLEVSSSTLRCTVFEGQGDCELWKQTVRMHPRSDSSGIPKASATRGDKHGQDSSHEKLAPRSTTILEKVSCAATILHEDCRSFLHRSRLSSMSAMLSGGPLPTCSYQDSLDIRAMPLSDPLFLHAHVTLRNR